MKTFLLLIVILSIGVVCLAQNAPLENKVRHNLSDDPQIPDRGTRREIQANVYDFVEMMPEFVGDKTAMDAFINKNLNYPQVARENGIHGIVVIEFIVDIEGNIINSKIARDIGGGCGAEAKRVVDVMPRWKPGKQNGTLVNVRVTLPVTFMLGDD